MSIDAVTGMCVISAAALWIGMKEKSTHEHQPSQSMPTVLGLIAPSLLLSIRRVLCAVFERQKEPLSRFNGRSSETASDLHDGYWKSPLGFQLTPSTRVLAR